jgi:hypothetical protein
MTGMSKHVVLLKYRIFMFVTCAVNWLMNENVLLHFDDAELNYGLHFYTFLSN